MCHWFSVVRVLTLSLSLCLCWKYPLKKVEVDPVGRCAGICAGVCRWRAHTVVHTQIRSLILWMPAGPTKNRGRVFLWSTECTVVFVCAHIQQRRIAVCIRLTHRWQWRTVPLKDCWKSPSLCIQITPAAVAVKRLEIKQLPEKHTLTHTQSNTGSTEQRCRSGSVGCRKANSKTAPCYS